eukprot:TRINITY_DN15789_c0_g1_i1.p1 TRINITY_DN15789_c0_g1~~TRINITY_DN15789_c0_g1_i1.p1  ORF type:complete len:343 (+),score=60.45 TRINITY_DN15789_c0_g1_i1:127-1155(+)
MGRLRGGASLAPCAVLAALCAVPAWLQKKGKAAFAVHSLRTPAESTPSLAGALLRQNPWRLERRHGSRGAQAASATEAMPPPRKMTMKQWCRYLFSVHGVSGALSVVAGSVWTTVRLAQGVKEASHSEVVFNVVLSAVILWTGIQRLLQVKNPDVVLKFWVGVSIQIFALVQILEAPLLGWIPYSIFGNWVSRIWGVLSVYFYVKWLLQIKKWNEAYKTKEDKTVARIFHPLMAPAMGSVVAMEIITFVNFVEVHLPLTASCPAAQWLFMDSQLVSLAVNNVAQFTLTLANQKKVRTIEPLFYILGIFGAVQFGLLMWVHLNHLGWAGLNAFKMIPLVCQAA